MIFTYRVYTGAREVPITSFKGLGKFKIQPVSIYTAASMKTAMAIDVERDGFIIMYCTDGYRAGYWSPESFHGSPPQNVTIIGPAE